MAQEAVDDDAIVLGVTAVGDADAVARLFLRAHGKVSVFARRARASKRRFPSLSAPSVAQARVREKSHTELWELLLLDVDPCVFGFSLDPRTFGHASYVVELLDRFVADGECNASAFDLASGALRTIGTTGASSVVLRAFELGLLHVLGWLPAPVIEDGAPCVAFDAQLGQFLSQPTPTSRAFGDQALQVARALLSAPSFAALPCVDDDVLREVGVIFSSHMRRMGGTPLKSVAFLRSL